MPEKKSTRSKLYSLEGGKLKRLRRACPRCGPEVFMADHGNRLACGKCGYTEFKKKSITPPKREGLAP